MPDIFNQNNLWVSIISISVFFLILVLAGLIQIILQKLYKTAQSKNPTRILPQIIKLIKNPKVGLICLYITPHFLRTTLYIVSPALKSHRNRSKLYSTEHKHLFRKT